MSRPLKDGVDYFPFDTNFYTDDKVRLLRAEFGAKGMYTLHFLLCEIYGKNGYFIKWDKSRCFLVSDGAGCGCSPEYISEFVAGCVRCSFFDERVLNMFGVLTSAGIQRRFMRMLKNRDEIEIIREYWLLDETSKKDVPQGVLNKLIFKTLKSSGNPDKSSDNPDKSSDNSQSKEEETKLNKNNTISSEQGEPAHEPVIKLLLTDGTLYPIYEKDVAMWQDGYPAVDIKAELKKMNLWFDANPKKRKTSRGIRSCIINWMARCQDKGGSSNYGIATKTQQNYNDATRYQNEKAGDISEF